MSKARGKDQKMLYPALYKSYFGAWMLHWISEDCSVSNPCFCQVLAKHRAHEVQTTTSMRARFGHEGCSNCLARRRLEDQKTWSSSRGALSQCFMTHRLQRSSLPNHQYKKVLEKEIIAPTKPKLPEMETRQLGDGDNVNNLNVCMTVKWKGKLGNIT